MDCHRHVIYINVLNRFTSFDESVHLGNEPASEAVSQADAVTGTMSGAVGGTASNAVSAAVIIAVSGAVSAAEHARKWDARSQRAQTRS